MKVNQLLKPLVLLLFLLNYVFGVTQNVGIGTSNPLNPLHVVGSTNVMLRLVSTNSFASEISFYTADGLKGYIGAYNNTLEVASVALEPVTLLTSGTQRMIVTAGGNVGIGSFTAPAEKFTIQSGNILLSSSDKGIILNGADRPMITRGFDPFTSGNYSGLGRWGMFMEPNRLVLGVPSTGGKAWEFSEYAANSTRTAVLTISSDNGAVRRPAQGNADLLPVCMGMLQTNGGIVTGTGNFTVFKDVAAGITEITVNNEAITDNGYIIVVTPVKLAISTSTGYAMTEVVNGGKFRVWTYSPGGGVANLAFRFVVYRLN